MKILIVDDQRSARRVLRQMLTELPESEVVEAESAADAFIAVTNESPDLVLLDVRLSSTDVRDRGGLDVLRKMRAVGVSTPAVMVTSLSEISEVREAMRCGAQDYIFKDELSPELVLPIVEAFRERVALRRDVSKLRERVDKGWGTTAIVGGSPGMDRLRKLIARVADSPLSVLIRGETGSGKEMVARAIHQSGARRDQPFVAVNCSALPGPLIESLVFGHERGAFTGAQRRVKGQLELAGRGTLLLDEIAEMPPGLQAKLLRVLEERRFRPLGAEAELPVHARIIAATHADIEKRISVGTFREDLYHRLNVVTLVVPPLVERVDDIPELVHAFCVEMPRKLSFTKDAMEWMRRRRWSGNVRELRNVVERVALLSDVDLIDAATLEELAPETPAGGSVEVDRLARELLALPDRVGSKLRAIERAVLQHAVETCNGNKSAAARLIGVDRKVLERRWERMNEAREEPDSDSDSD